MSASAAGANCVIPGSATFPVAWPVPICNVLNVMRPFRWRDSAFAFAIGLSLLTVLVIPHWNWLILARHRSYILELSGALSKVGFLFLGSASLGMFIGGLIAYWMTRREGKRVIRCVPVAFLTAVIAFPIGISVFCFSMVPPWDVKSSHYTSMLGLFTYFGVLFYGIPCLAVTVLWSLLYTAQIPAGPEASPPADHARAADASG
jgi:hypothetical protein